jgi:hypothetical protein
MPDVIHSVDPGKFILSIGAPGGVANSPITGYGPDTMIEISRDAQAFEKEVGGDGEVTRIRNRNTAGKIKIILNVGSTSNVLLTNLANLDEVSGGGVIPISFFDMSGLLPNNTMAAATYAWIMKKPDRKFQGKAGGTVEWTFDCGSLEFFLGAN